MNAFVPWIGGKTRLAKTIVAMLPEERTGYIEVFGGGAKVLFKKKQKKGEVEVYNDVHDGLVNLFRVVRDQMDLFQWRQYFLLSSRSEYHAYQERYKKGEYKDDIEKAIAFYYLIVNSFGAGVTTGWAYARSRQNRYPACLRDMEMFRERLLRVYIESQSFEALIPKWDGKGAVFYCDPPYYMLTEMSGGYYKHDLTPEMHVNLRDILRGIEGKFILSYDNHPKVRMLYKKFHIRETDPIHYSLNHRPGSKGIYKKELLITNF